MTQQKLSNAFVKLAEESGFKVTIHWEPSLASLIAHASKLRSEFFKEDLQESTYVIKNSVFSSNSLEAFIKKNWSEIPAKAVVNNFKDLCEQTSFFALFSEHFFFVAKGVMEDGIEKFKDGSCAYTIDGVTYTSLVGIKRAKKLGNIKKTK